MKESSKRRVVHSPLQLNPALDSECQRLEDLLMRRDDCERKISRKVSRLMAIEQLLDQLQTEDPDLALHAAARAGIKAAALSHTNQSRPT